MDTVVDANYDEGTGEKLRVREERKCGRRAEHALLMLESALEEKEGTQMVLRREALARLR